MKSKPSFTILFALLVLAGAYGIALIVQDKKTDLARVTQAQAPSYARNAAAPADNSALVDIDATTLAKTSRPAEIARELQQTATLLENGQYRDAVALVDSLYQRLSTNQLEQFEALFLTTAEKHWHSSQSAQAVALLNHYTDTFNSLGGWVLLSTIQMENKQWLAAINALLKATAIEYRPDKVKELMTNLTVAARHQRAMMERQKDELGIQQLYQNLYEHHPDNPHFQLELASSYLRLNDVATAQGLLEPLQYDAEIGAIAETALTLLKSNATTIPDKPEDIANKHRDQERVVPLLRSGNSFFVNTVVNNRQLRLLLDTGASITALSQSAIKSLGLEPTGRNIQLNTANGVRSAQLYRADQIMLGGLSINDLQVAEIEFEKNSQIHGLLGTDLLNQLDNRYTYVIDNERNALIFKSK